MHAWSHFQENASVGADRDEYLTSIKLEVDQCHLLCQILSMLDLVSLMFI